MPPIEKTVDSLEGLNEEIAGLYKQGDDGKYHLSIPGFVPKEKVDEFRNSATSALKQLDEFKQKYGDLDPEKAREALAKAEELEKKKLIDAGKVDELIGQEVKKVAEKNQKVIEELNSKLQEREETLKKLLIDKEVTAIGAELNVWPQALADLTTRVRSQADIHDGKAVVIGEDGKPVYGANGELKTLKELITEMKESAPHLFQPSGGGGSQGGQRRGGENRNLSAREKIAKGLENRGIG